MREHDPVQALTARYDREAPAYRQFWGPVLAPITATWLATLRPTDVRRVVDVGSGVGDALPLLRRRFPDARLVGVDRSRGMLGQVPHDVPLACMDASRVALASDSFDFALLAFVLFHLPDPDAGLREIRRILRPGGTVALTTWAGEAESAATRVWAEELDALGATPADDLEHLAHHEWMDSTAKVRTLLEVAGFIDAEATRHDATHPMRPDDFLALKTTLGRSRRRLQSLDDEAQRRCLENTKRRFVTLRSDDFTLRLPVIFASARCAK